MYNNAPLSDSGAVTHITAKDKQNPVYMYEKIFNEKNPSKPVATPPYAVWIKIINGINIGNRKYNVDENHRSTNNSAGFRKEYSEGVAYYVLPEVFREICTGHNPTWAAKTLVEKGYLQTGGDGKPQDQRRLPGFPNGKRVYAFTASIMNDANPSTPENKGNGGNTGNIS